MGCSDLGENETLVITNNKKLHVTLLNISRNVPMNRQIKVRGKVQGVFFRKHAQQKALELGLTGWVRNEPDGTVALEIEGEIHALIAMQSWLKMGPPMAQVEGLEVRAGEEKGYQDFLIVG